MSLRDRLKLPDEPIYLIDGSSFIYRGFHAFSGLLRSDGLPTNALYAVARLLMRLVREERPRYAAFVTDAREKTFRAEVYPEYKAHREAMPEDLAAQIAPIKAFASLLGFTHLEQPGFEADDIIASLTARFQGSRPVVIVGSDKDLRQCLTPNVTLWDPSGKNEKIVTESRQKEEYPFAPASWPDFQALVGDSSDNIPGVPGVGPKTASTIISRFPTLEALREGFAGLEPKMAAKLADHMQAVFTYRELTRLKTDLTVVDSLDALGLHLPDPAALKDFLQEYELRTLMAEAARLSQNAVPMTQDAPPAKPPSKAKSKAKADPRGSLFGATLSDAPSPTSPSPTGQGSLGGDHAQAPTPKPQVSAASLPDLHGKRVGLSAALDGFCLNVDGQVHRLAKSETKALVVALQNAERIAVPSFKALLARFPELENLSCHKIFDVSLAGYLLAPEERDYSLTRLAAQAQVTASFATEAATLAVGIAEVLAPRIAEAGMDELIYKLETPLSVVLARMEKRGLAVDEAAFAEFLDEVAAEIVSLEARIIEQAGAPINPRSSQQLSEVLFTKLGLKPAGKTPKGVASTSSEVLDRLSGAHPIIESILAFRTLDKLRSTYLEPLPRLLGPDKRLHTTFNQMATATGRLSSSNPNLQNIPIRGVHGPRMRACFVAAPGKVLVAADYSQIELRVLARFSKDPALIEAFANKADIHARTAGLLFDKSEDTVSKDERRAAKTINFGLLYGMGPQKLARELGVSMREAKEFIEKYFERLGALKAFYEKVVEQATIDGYVTTLAGRRRPMPELESRNGQVQSQAKRQAINTVIQGSAADIIKMAMLATEHDDGLADLKAMLVLQVHDELLLEVDEANAQAAASRLAQIMCGIYKMQVDLAVDVGYGTSWAKAH